MDFRIADLDFTPIIEAMADGWPKDASGFEGAFDLNTQSHQFVLGSKRGRRALSKFLVYFSLNAQFQVMSATDTCIDDDFVMPRARTFSQASEIHLNGKDFVQGEEALYAWARILSTAPPATVFYVHIPESNNSHLFALVLISVAWFLEPTACRFEPERVHIVRSERNKKIHYDNLILNGGRLPRWMNSVRME